MAVPNPVDPFLEAQSDLLATLQQTRSLHSSYLRIRSLAASASSPELSQARQELENALRDLTVDLQDLVDSVKAVEGDPYKYGLDEQEVSRRRQLVRDVGDEVERMREEALENNGRAGASGKQRSNGSAALPLPSDFDDLDRERTSDDYAAFEQQRQTEMMHEQDDQLDGVFRTVGNLRAQADTMGRELEEQVGMVQDADQIADRVGGKLQHGIKKVGWVIKNNEETWSSCCIGALILVLVLLLILVIVL